MAWYESEMNVDLTTIYCLGQVFYSFSFLNQTIGIAILSLSAVRMFCTISNQKIESSSTDTFFTVCSKDPNSIVLYPIKQFSGIPEFPMILFFVLYLSIQGLQ